MNKFVWLLEEIKWFLLRCVHVTTGKYLTNSNIYGRQKLYSSFEGNEEISKKLNTNEPFAFCRFSFVEMDLMIKNRTKQYWGISTYALKKDLIKMYEVQGKGKYYGIQKFCSIMNDATEYADILGIWRNIPMGDAYVRTVKKINDKKIVDACAVESYCFENPWTASLAGKKVLVVSPFYKEIESQYIRRELLWDNDKILPQFELETMDSVWYFFGCKDDRFSDWFEALDYLLDEIMKKNFDVVLLGCGAFGFPLAAKIKQSGKQAIHMGGALQILFGIKGKRWDNTGISNYYNEYWIRPESSTKPKEAEKLDQNCYW